MPEALTSKIDLSLYRTARSNSADYQVRVPLLEPQHHVSRVRPPVHNYLAVRKLGGALEIFNEVSEIGEGLVYVQESEVFCCEVPAKLLILMLIVA